MLLVVQYLKKTWLNINLKDVQAHKLGKVEKIIVTKDDVMLLKRNGICLYSVLGWCVSIYWTIAESLGLSLLDYDGWMFWCILWFGFQEFWVFLHQYS